MLISINTREEQIDIEVVHPQAKIRELFQDGLKIEDPDTGMTTHYPPHAIESVTYFTERV